MVRHGASNSHNTLSLAGLLGEALLYLGKAYLGMRDFTQALKVG